MLGTLARLVFVGIVLSVAAGPTAVAGDANRALYSVAPLPQWVEPVAPDLDTPPPTAGVRDGTYYLLDDTQVRVLAHGRETYSHFAMRALTAAGVRETGQINLYVDPAFQSLVLHYVRIIRDGHVVERLGRARITSVPVETELESRIYNGTYNVNILLEDLRIGDVVEYAFTRVSRDPLWSDHFSMTAPFGWAQPLRHKRLRIIYPLDRQLHYQVFGGEAPARESVLNGQRELRFEWHDTPAIADLSSRPGWYSPWPWLEISDWVDWGEVARRAASLYTEPGGAQESLNNAVRSIRDGGRTIEERAKLALQFAQEQIRYTSIAIGVRSQKPASPQTVLTRRFGDCKDKSLLLVSLLKGLGIEAVPALVSTTHGHTLPGRLPSMALFDHVITRVSLPSGTYWVDPTAAKQLRAISLLDPPDFEFALPLTSATRGLQAIRRPDTAPLRREVTVTIDAGQGFTAPAKLDVVTRYLGPEVDWMRATLEATPPAERQKKYLNYYAQYYPGIQSVALPGIEESADHDAIVVSEHYRLDSGFSKDADGSFHLTITADELSRYSEKLDGVIRKSPLEIPFPVNVVQSFLVILPDSWPSRHDVVHIDNPAFRYGSEIRTDKNQLHARYYYVALKDHVPVEQLPKYLSDRTGMHDDLGYRLTNPTAATDLSDYAIAPLPFAVLLLALAGGVFLAVRVYRFDPPPRLSAEPGSPEGIRGWLLLPALNAMAMPLITTYLMGAFFLYVRSDVWTGIVETATPDARGWVRWALLICFGFTGALLPVTIAGVLLFFRKRTSAPFVLMALWFGSVTIGGATQSIFLWSGLDDTTKPEKLWTDVVRDTLSALVWSAYLLKSQRVRATFVRRRPAAGEMGVHDSLPAARPDAPCDVPAAAPPAAPG